MSSLTSTVLVASNATVQTQAQYTNTDANAFFSAQATAGTAAPRLPADAGQLLLAATDSLTLNSPINFATGSFVAGTSAGGAPIIQQGRGGDVAITAQNIIVVDPGANSPQPAGTLELNVQQLDDLDAQTLILGASSTSTAAGEQLNLGSAGGGGTQTVELQNTTALTAPEIILAAQDSVTVDPNAAIVASGSGAPGQAPTTLLLPGGGALLRVASGAAEALSIDPATLPQNSTAGTVSIGAGATVQGSGSLLLYGTHDTTLAPGARISAPAVSLYSSVVNLGDAPAGSAGLVLTDPLLNSLEGLTDLTLGSTSTINFYGALQLGTPGSNSPTLSSINLDAPGLVGYGAGDKVLQAGNITWTNSSGAAAGSGTAPDGSGALELLASGGSSPNSGQLTLGAGSKTASGFSALDLQAAGDIVGQGAGTLTVTGSAVPVNVTAATLIGAAGSNQTLTTSGAVTISAAAAAGGLSLPSAGAGAQWAIQGSAIAQDGSIELPSGALSLVATSGDVTLGAGSLTAAAGAIQGYTVSQAVAPGGQITLSARAGNVTIGSGATVDVSGSASGTASGDAGTLNVSAPLGTFTFAGSTLKAGAPTGRAQGNFSLDVGSGLGGDGFGAVNAMLGSSGFAGAIDLRSRTDGTVSIADTVQASSFELAVDQGTINVAATGVINTSGAGPGVAGGTIALWAGQDVNLEAGAHLLANAGPSGPVGTNGTALATQGGDVTLGTSAGEITIDGGSAAQRTTISLQGTGAADTDGQLTLRAPRTADDTGVQVQVQNAPSLALVTRNPLIVEGFKTYTASALGNVDMPSANGCTGSCDIADLNGALFTQAQTFVANTAGIVANDLGGLANVEVRPGIEVDSPGDLTVGNTATAVWDLASWNAALGVPVNLTLRAGGNLVLNASLSDGFTNNGKAVADWKFGEPGTATDSASYALAGVVRLNSGAAWASTASGFAAVRSAPAANA